MHNQRVLARLARFSSILALCAALEHAAIGQDSAANSTSSRPNASSRALLEQARYAETHQRDFAAAEAGYRQAVEVARAANDGTAADAAQTALQALLVRQGKQAPVDGAGDQIPAGAWQALTAELEAYANDLVLYGDQIVPVLARLALAAEGERVELVNGDKRVVRVDNQLAAAMVLTKIATSSSDEALIRVLGSPNPVLRRKLVGMCPVSRSTVLRYALNDQVEAVRRAARARLLDGDDPRTAEQARIWAAEGAEDAVVWLCRHDWRSAWALAAKGVPGIEIGAWMTELGKGGMIREGVGAVQEGAELRAASNDPVFREQSGLLLQQLAFRLGMGQGSARNTPEALAALHDVARRHRLEFLISILAAAEEDPAQRLVTAEAYARGLPAGDPAVEQAVSELLPPATTQRAVPSDKLLALVAALSARGDAAPDLKALEAIANWRMQRCLRMDGVAARKAGLIEETIGIDQLLRTPAQRDAARAVVERLMDGYKDIEDRTCGLLPAGSMPPEASKLVAWLLRAPRSSQAVANALGIQYGSAPAGTLPLLCDLVAQDAAIRATGPQAASIVARAWAADPAATKALLATRLEQAVAAAADGAAPALEGLVRQAHLTSNLPAAAATEVIKQASLKAAPACRMRLACPSPLLTKSDAVANDATLALMVELLSDADLDAAPEIAVDALEVFRRTLHAPALPLVGKALRSSSHPVREAAQAAMNDFRRQREALEEFDLWMQAARQQTSTISQLVELLGSNDRTVVLGAVKALGTIKARSALPALVKLLERADPELRAALDAAIAAM